MSIAVVTDSTCDIPADIVSGAGLTVIPALVNIGMQSFRDGVDLNRQDFYRMLPDLKELPRTATPSPVVFEEVYRDLLGKHDAVLSLHPAAQLSGLFNAASLAAREVDANRIQVVDTGQLSMGLGWAVLAAADAAQQQGSTAQALESVHYTLARMRVFALFNTVEYLRQGGRINMVQAGLTSLLNIKPLVELAAGSINPVARIRTWSKAVTALGELIHQLAPFDRIAVMHSNCAECATDLLARISTVLPGGSEPLITSVTTTIGTHVGPHALGVALVCKSP